jgi:chemotaxis protein MotB
MQIVGDRFVVPSELLFASGSDRADTRRRSAQLDATRRRRCCEVSAEIPSGARLGAAHRRPHRQAPDPHRALSLQLGALRRARDRDREAPGGVQGIPAKRLAANGFGEFRPLDPSDTPKRPMPINRRIEIQLTNR